ncbi:MAG TPA: helix-turn-helix transcriptional regulator [Candidatus Paceibacterota bacterium]|nr:helix-turn-helix transcriptional regulator [Candidatus Paceibacterota bacterium]
MSTKILDYAKIGIRVRELRLQHDLTQLTFAKKIGVTRVEITKIETGKQKIYLKTLVRISQEFDVSLDWLVFGDEK